MPFNKPRKVCVFTGSRSEYGLMRFLIKAIEEEEALELQLCVTGSHLSELHGRTISEIKNDGVEITSILPLSIESDVVNTMADLSAQTMSSMSQEIKRLRPDVVIVLGDRYEAFAAAAAAFLCKVPVLHIHGGETTEGALDNSLRHAITQISSWHFTAAEAYRQKVIRLGQPENRVFNVGPMVIDALAQPIKACREEFENLTGFRFGPKNALVTFHPETLLPDNGVACFRELITALEKSHFNILFTHPNADEGFREILFEINNFVSKRSGRSWAVASLGQDLYLQALNLFDTMIGNTSSGIIEGPLVGIPVINIGNRQGGRIRYGAVKDVGCNSGELLSSLESITSKKKPNKGIRFSVENKPTNQIIRFLVNQVDL